MGESQVSETVAKCDTHSYIGSVYCPYCTVIEQAELIEQLKASNQRLRAQLKCTKIKEAGNEC